jgi:hypothetical protein
MTRCVGMKVRADGPGMTDGLADSFATTEAAKKRQKKATKTLVIFVFSLGVSAFPQIYPNFNPL